jgi:type I restriction enzyme S subunit
MSSWHIKKLSELGTFSKGAGILKDSVLSEGLPAVRYGELYTVFDVFIKKVRSFINGETAQDSREILYGDILFAGSGETIDEIGKSAVYQHNASGYAGGDIVVLRPDSKNDCSFLAYALNSPLARKELRRLGQGQSVVHVYRKDLETMSLSIPEKPEQERIVAVLEVWDEYLELLYQKITMKERLKKGLMQQLLTGKKRLPGFTGVWQEYKIGDVVGISKGKALSSSGLKEGSYPVIAGGKTSPYKHSLYTHENVITISASGAYAGYVAHHDYRIWASDCSVVSEKNNISSIHFFAHYLKFIQRRIYSYQSGGAQPHIYPKDIAFIKIRLPEIKEQIALSNVLGTASDGISVLESIRYEVLEQKKYLLKNLISGIIRTPENLQTLDKLKSTNK